MSNKAGRYLGLARRAGKLAAGYDTCTELIKKRKVKLLLLTSDLSEKTTEKFYGLAETHKIPIYTYGTSDHMFHITGMPNRNIFAVLDENLANAVKSELELTAQN